MPRYRAKERVFVDNSIREPGEEFVTNAPPHPTAWELLDAPVAKGGKEAPPAKDEPLPDAFEKMSDEQLENFFLTKTGKAFDPKVKTREQKLARCRAIGEL